MLYIIYQRNEDITPNPHQPIQKLKHHMMPLGHVVYNWLFVNLILMLSTDIVRVSVMWKYTSADKIMMSRTLVGHVITIWARGGASCNRENRNSIIIVISNVFFKFNLFSLYFHCCLHTQINGFKIQISEIYTVKWQQKKPSPFGKFKYPWTTPPEKISGSMHTLCRNGTTQPQVNTKMLEQRIFWISVWQ